MEFYPSSSLDNVVLLGSWCCAQQVSGSYCNTRLILYALQVVERLWVPEDVSLAICNSASNFIRRGITMWNILFHQSLAFDVIADLAISFLCIQSLTFPYCIFQTINTITQYWSISSPCCSIPLLCVAIVLDFLSASFMARIEIPQSALRAFEKLTS